jgi:hypothetical protein
MVADCREARRQGVRGRHRYRCENEGSDYCQTKENVNRLDCFHTDDPPLIVEIILEVWSKRRMTGLEKVRKHLPVQAALYSQRLAWIEAVTFCPSRKLDSCIALLYNS